MIHYICSYLIAKSDLFEQLILFYPKGFFFNYLLTV